MKKLKFIISGILLLVVFALFSKYVKAGHLRNTDFATTIRIQNHIPSRFDEFMADGAIFADPIVSTGLVLLVTGVAFIRIKGKRKLLVAVIPLSFAALTILEVYGKNFVPHPGPPFFLIKHPTTIFPEFTVIQPFSYPSGHMARITFLGVITLFLTMKQFSNLAILRKRLWILVAVIIYMAFIGISRIYLGHHWFSDILGGALLGASAALTGLSWLL